MPVKVVKKRKTATLTCEGCEKTLDIKLPQLTAAPELDACEIAHKEHGWGYTIGFFSMLAGPRVLCPPCARPSEFDGSKG